MSYSTTSRRWSRELSQRAPLERPAGDAWETERLAQPVRETALGQPG
ncbi:MAG: hypothetical protein QGG36_03250 [Pirellulaceae bacterium]|nr:hypothetical protein [Pirellulaceae bacterium]